MPRARAPGRAIERIVEREAFSIGTVSRGDNLSDFDGISQQDSPWKSESTGTSNYPNAHSHSPVSKQSASHDSDAWHSESEANWTMYQTKDITQSQVLSEDEHKQSGVQSGVAYTPSWSKTPVHRASPSPHLQPDRAGLPAMAEDQGGPQSLSSSDVSEVYKFEPRRPVELFGECSWNSLSLAKSSNLVKSGVLAEYFSMTL